MNSPHASETQPVALVTGSVRGIGLAIARTLQARGERVHIVWRGSQALARELEEQFQGRVHRADLCAEADARALVEAVLARDGRIDRVIHAVGEYVAGPLEHATIADLRRLYASNVESAFLLVNAARAALRSARGNIVLLGCAGLDGLRGRRETAAYSAMKSALLVLARSWALEEAAHGVRVNMVSPGIVPHAHAAAETLDPARAARIPLGRTGTPEDVAAAVAFLCSERANYTTGADLPVSGGWLI